MKRLYRFIHFEPWKDEAGEKNKYGWDCLNNRTNAILATVVWYGPWKRFELRPEPGTGFSMDCLADIQDFTKQLKPEGES